MASHRDILAAVDIGQIELERDSGVGVVLVLGEHDLNTAPSLAERLRTLIEAGSAAVVDLSGASFIDSSILGVVLDARRRAHEAGLGFDVAAGQGTGEGVLRVLEVTGLDSSLPVLSNREEAVQRASEGPPR
jgi:anti-sigma B factor antagonist